MRHLALATAALAGLGCAWLLGQTNPPRPLYRGDYNVIYVPADEAAKQGLPSGLLRIETASGNIDQLTPVRNSRWPDSYVWRRMNIPMEPVVSDRR